MLIHRRTWKNAGMATQHSGRLHGVDSVESCRDRSETKKLNALLTGCQ